MSENYPIGTVLYAVSGHLRDSFDRNITPPEDIPLLSLADFIEKYVVIGNGFCVEAAPDGETKNEFTAYAKLCRSENEYANVWGAVNVITTEFCYPTIEEAIDRFIKENITDELSSINSMSKWIESQRGACVKSAEAGPDCHLSDAPAQKP